MALFEPMSATDIARLEQYLAGGTQPPLTSVRQPVEEMGREMARLVISLAAVKGHAPQRVVLEPDLALRASSVRLASGVR